MSDATWCRLQRDRGEGDGEEQRQLALEEVLARQRDEGGDQHREHDRDRSEARLEADGDRERAQELGEGVEHQARHRPDPDRVPELRRLPAEQHLRLADAVHHHHAARAEAQDEESEVRHGQLASSGSLCPWGGGAGSLASARAVVTEDGPDPVPESLLEMREV